MKAKIAHSLALSAAFSGLLAGTTERLTRESAATPAPVPAGAGVLLTGPETQEARA